MARTEWAQAGRRWLHRAVNFVLPPVCAACHAATMDGGQLCAGCWSNLSFITPPVCQVLGAPLPYDPGVPVISPAAQADPPPWARARAAVAYGDTARQLVGALKYRDRLDVARLMATMMARAGADLIADADLLLPMPLHRHRLWQRRFNQAQELARHLAKQTGKSGNPFILVRQKPTRQQVGLSATARRRNVRGAFALDPERCHLVDGCRILLIDDVLTTGATARAAVATLRRAGATVDVLTFAMVVETG